MSHTHGHPSLEAAVGWLLEGPDTCLDIKPLKTQSLGYPGLNRERNVVCQRRLSKRASKSRAVQKERESRA